MGTTHLIVGVVGMTTGFCNMSDEVLIWNQVNQVVAGALGVELDIVHIANEGGINDKTKV